jgi:uncharacterized protein (DUF1330 family)
MAHMAISLCVLLWAKPGFSAGLRDYEDRVLALLGDHGGRVLQRAVLESSADHPSEVQLIEFDAESGVESFLADPRRTAMAHERDRLVERTETLRVAEFVAV